MPIFIKYQYQIAGEADIKRSLTSVAQHAERENARVLKSQTRLRVVSQSSSADAKAKDTTKATERAEEARLKAEEKANKKATAAAIKEHDRAEREKTKRTEKEARERAKIEEQWARKQVQLRDQHFRAQERKQRAEEAATARARAQFYATTKGVVGGTARTVSNIAGGALAVSGLGGVALAANALHGGMATEKSALGLANQMAGEGATPEQIRKKAKEITKRAQSVKGFSPEEILSSARAFGGISGDYQLGLDMSDDLSQIALATDVNLEEISKVAGNAFSKIKGPGVSNAQAKTQTLEAVRTFAGQGNIGAVEIKDLAQYGGRLTSGAMRFQGTRIENMKRMGTLAQVAAGFGATDAAEATEAAIRFADDLSTHAEKVGQLQIRGKSISAFTDPGKGKGKNTQMRGIQDIISDVMEATGGSQTMLGEIFGARSKKMTDFFALKYTEAEKANAALPAKQRQQAGKAGRSAIAAEFEKFDRASLSVKDQQLRADAALSGTTAQLNNAIKDLNDKLASELLPNMPQLVRSVTEMTPLLVGLVREFSSLVGWLATNPLSGLSALIGAAFLKELAAAKINDIIKTAILGGKGGAAGIMLPAIAVGAATFAITSAVLSIAEAESQRRGERGAEQTNTIWEEYGTKQNEIMSGPGTPEEKAAKLVELAGSTRKKVATTREAIQVGSVNPAVEIAENSSPEGFWGKLFKSMSKNMGSPYATNPQFDPNVTDSPKAREADKAARKFEKELEVDQLRAAKLLIIAAEKLSSGGSATTPAVVPYRGNTPAVR